MGIRTFAAFVVLIAGAARAEQAPPANPVQDFYASCISEVRTLGEMYAASASQIPRFTTEHERIFAEAKECIEQRFKPALDDAVGTPSLVEAIKSYYVGAQTWLSELRLREGSKAAYERKAERAWQAFNPMAQRLLMEAKLAGKM